MGNHPKLLAISLDAASPHLLREWGADGTMPNVGRLLREGISGPSRSPDGFYHGATWLSFATGNSPGRHGIYWLQQLRPGGYDQYRLTTEQLSRYPALWDVLGGAGRRVGVFDVPFDRPRPSFPGVHGVEWYTHDPLFGFQTTPAHFAEEIDRARERHAAAPKCDEVRGSVASYRRFIDQMTGGAALRSRIARRLFAGAPLDFAIVVFAETHCSGHQLWHLHDPAHPGHDPEVVARTGDGLREVYMAVDRAVGEVLAEVAGPETTVVLLDLHGMSFTAGAWLLLPEVLERLGHFTRLPPPPPTSLGRRTGGPLWRLLPEGLRDALAPLKRTIMGPPPPPTRPGVAPAQFIPGSSRCFPIQLGHSVSGIRFNIVGRESQGVLRPDEVEAFGADLIDVLTSLRNPDTGHPLTEAVRWTRDLYQGEAVAGLPDLFIDWDLARHVGSAKAGNGAGGVVRATSPRLGTIERENTNCRSGEHRNEGLFVACGPGIAPGRLDRTVATMDYAPTFARMLGVEMECEGRPIDELIPARLIS